jgi:sirohydrochlorin ferrochelatase
MGYLMEVAPTPGDPYVKAILLIDHGSTRHEANEMLACVANLVQVMAGRRAVVRHAHMELADPTIEQGVRACIDAGATEIVAFPYMLSPGKHSIGDIPRLVSAAAAAYPEVRVSVTPAFGVHEKLAEVVLLRAQVEPEPSFEAVSACVCWNPVGRIGACGSACRVAPAPVESPEHATP